MTNPPCPIRALMHSGDLRYLADRCIRAEMMYMVEVHAKQALEAENRILRGQLAAVLGPKREVA